VPTLITRIKISSTFQFIYLIWHVFSPVSKKLTPSIVSHSFHFMSIIRLKDRGILLNTVVKWRCLDLHRTSKIDFLKFYFRFRMCLYKIKIFLIPIKVPQGAKSLQWLYNSKIHNNKLYKETIQTIMHCSKYNAFMDMHCRRWLFLDRHLIG
jgi:hypothetical protein